jgi:hypothetical protein
MAHATVSKMEENLSEQGRAVYEESVPSGVYSVSKILFCYPRQRKGVMRV